VILALDTTSEFGSLALADAAGVQEVVPVHSREGFGHVIFAHIVTLLERHHLALADVEGYAAASGPGSFTGVRVGLTIAKGLAEVHGRRVVPVSNLLAMASAAEGDVRVPVLDARRGEIYGAAYDAALHPVVEEVVAPWQKFLALLPERDLVFVATDFDPFRAALAGTRWESARVVTIPRTLAGLVATVAVPIFAAGHALLPEQADANYVRRSDAELLWKEQY
jgi:tRNA threonylcarbamoyladenosine biosynthesis protein TsaB